MRLLIGLSLISLATPAFAESAPFPEFDIARTCRAQAEYAYAATLGQQNIDREIAACSVTERENRYFARTLWSRASPKDQRECQGLSEAKYGYLARCLDAGQPVRTAH